MRVGLAGTYIPVLVKIVNFHIYRHLFNVPDVVGTKKTKMVGYSENSLMNDGLLMVSYV